MFCGVGGSGRRDEVVAYIFYLLRKEETYNEQAKLTEWILQMPNDVVLYWNSYEIKVEWGNGLAQEREAEEARTEEMELQKTKPFARTRDDPVIERMLKEKVRWGDPMTHFVKVTALTEDLATNNFFKRYRSWTYKDAATKMNNRKRLAGLAAVSILKTTRLVSGSIDDDEENDETTAPIEVTITPGNDLKIKIQTCNEKLNRVSKLALPFGILQQTTHLTAECAIMDSCLIALRGAATFKARALKEAWNTTVVIPVDRGVKVNKNNGKSNGYREDLLPEENLLGMYNLHWKIVSAYIHGRIVNPFFTQRIKSNFVFAGPSKTAETLFKYIAPELVPVQYGGLIREGEQDFTASDSITEDIIKPATKHRIQFPVTEFGASTKAPGYNVFPDGTEESDIEVNGALFTVKNKSNLRLQFTVTALRNKKHESQERVCLAQSCGEYGRVNFSSVGELRLDYRRAWMGSTFPG
ncbi:cellular retinaldehyde binding/alpha-tocopherol transport [Tanacetum coccineum]